MKTALLVMVFMLFGCATPVEPAYEKPTYEQAYNNRFIKANHSAAEALAKSVTVMLDKSQPIIVATLVNIDNLEASSTLGRTISEQLSSKLITMGYLVKEIKLRGTLFVKSNEGELLLSRELKEISTSHNAQAVVVGTYSNAGDYLYLSLKLINATSNVAIGAHDYALPVDTNVAKMLGIVLKNR